MVFGLNAMLLTRDLFSLYLFLEVASIASYVLVAFGLGCAVTVLQRMTAVRRHILLTP